MTARTIRSNHVHNKGHKESCHCVSKTRSKDTGTQQEDRFEISSVERLVLSQDYIWHKFSTRSVDAPLAQLVERGTSIHRKLRNAEVASSTLSGGNLLLPFFADMAFNIACIAFMLG